MGPAEENLRSWRSWTIADGAAAFDAAVTAALAESRDEERAKHSRLLAAAKTFLAAEADPEATPRAVLAEERAINALAAVVADLGGNDG